MWKLIRTTDAKKKWKEDYPNKTEIMNFLFYDTLPGNSGSPVIGRGADAQGQRNSYSKLWVTNDVLSFVIVFWNGTILQCIPQNINSVTHLRAQYIMRIIRRCFLLME